MFILDLEASEEQSENPDSDNDSDEIPLTDCELNTSCPCICCTGSEISQPNDVNLFKRTGEVYGKGKNKRKFYFNAAWYELFSWIHFCCSSLKVFWFECTTASNNPGVIMSNKAGPAYTSVGFSNWKYAKKISNTSDVPSSQGCCFH